jgi:two-component system, OmpR family, response regulator ResD
MIMDMQRTVLVVDDEPTIVDVVSRYLQRAGYQTRQAYAGPEAVSVALDCQPDLIVLDLMLPGFDGYEVMRRLSDESGPATPVILLTARGEESDRIVGLRRGADDYVVKPFSPAEIVARVDAVLRRAAPEADGPTDEEIVADELRIDPVGRIVERGGEEIALTAREFDLLLHLASHPDRVFTRDQLMDAVWNTNVFSDTSTVTVHVRRLRAKIERDPAVPRYIETARGVGYRFRSR